MTIRWKTNRGERIRSWKQAQLTEKKVALEYHLTAGTFQHLHRIAYRRCSTIEYRLGSSF